MAKTESQLEELAAYRNMSRCDIQQKDLSFPKFTNSGEETRFIFTIGDDCRG